MKVLFAPDYRAGVPYQELLAQALSRHGVDVSFLTNYRRGLPLWRGNRDVSPDLLHIHWPEKYFARKGDAWDWLRVQRYPLDHWLTARRQPIVLTAHNLLPHNRADEAGIFRNFKLTARRAQAVFVHSPEARRRMQEVFGLDETRIHLIPFGDHAVPMGAPAGRDEARAKLGLGHDEKICLIFGTVSPYKGTDDVVRFWARAGLRHRLVVVGPVLSETFAAKLRDLAAHSPAIDLRMSPNWLSDDDLRLWLSAADCCIFNYREIFTSGAASLARSYGIPILIPTRLTATDLMEPHPHVFRFGSFDTDFPGLLDKALSTPCSYDLARPWRERTSWAHVADLTYRVYREVLNPRRSEDEAPSHGRPAGDVAPGRVPGLDRGVEP